MYENPMIPSIVVMFTMSCAKNLVGWISPERLRDSQAGILAGSKTPFKVDKGIMLITVPIKFIKLG